MSGALPAVQEDSFSSSTASTEELPETSLLTSSVLTPTPSQDIKAFDKTPEQEPPTSPSAEESSISSVDTAPVVEQKKLIRVKPLSAVQRDEIQVLWYKKAIEQGNVAAQYKLGMMYASNRGVELLSSAERDKKAVFWYEKAAMQGDNAYAQYLLAQMYQNNRGVEPLISIERQKKALFWYEKAARQKHTAAQHRLGVIYEDNHGVEKEHLNTEDRYKIAVYWYQEAAIRGHIAAQYSLGRMYECNQGVGNEKLSDPQP